MKTHFTKDSVLEIFNVLKRKALAYEEKTNIKQSLKYIKAAGSWMYNFNVLYADAELDSLIKKISASLWSTIDLGDADENTIAVLDSFGWANRGLTQQYVRGLIKNGYKVIYILHALNLSASKSLLDEIKAYDNIETVVFENNPAADIPTTGKIIDILKERKPSKILVHLNVNDVVLLMAIANIKGADIYNINLTDHAFWLGAGLIEYNFEFRDYGEKVSLQKRGLDKSQIQRLPYFPIMPKKAKFEGFPDLPKDAIVVFTGGAEYKMLGGNDIFFKLMDTVLSIADNVYILVAGVHEKSVFSAKVAQMKHPDRVKIIGVRKDINEVFAHSDIYLGTYPYMGGLMSQYAAHNKLPILAYTEKVYHGAETVVCHKSERWFSNTTIDDFKAYAKQLICDEDFRHEEGQKNYDVIIKEEDFYEKLSMALNHQKYEMNWIKSKPNYDSFVKSYLENENNSLHSGLFLLLKSLRWEAVKLLGKEIFPASFLVLQKGKNKLLQKFRS